MPRVGIGYDIHRLIKGRKLVLGGIHIPYKKGLLGHSDADVLLHAISDALLGALALGDIGEHFPDTALEYRGISSLKLLKQVYALVKNKKYAVENIDTVLIAQEPKLTPFKKDMQKAIAGALGIKEGAVSIKAATAEGLGPIGNKEAIAAYAVVSLSAKNRSAK